MYKIWSSYLLMFSILLFVVGLYYLSIDYLVLLDWEVITVNSTSLSMTVMLDWMSLIFMSSVLLISSMVIFYSNSYMSGDLFKIRFLLLVLLFVMSMMFLIISPNLVSILLGWDGLGLVSYSLVVYFQNYKSFNAGMLTIMTNRIGDIAILISIAWFFNNGGFNFIFYIYSFDYWSLWIVLLISLAAFTSSAQIPFSSWLPSAMAAPTPVSALVHSSTLVTAGVYLLIRFNDYLASFDMSILLLMSCLTMFMSGLGANFEYDMKKIIALSTLSQLGFMMSALFMGYPILSYFHMLTHAFFKALLFLCAGLIIHCMGGSQDIRHMGCLSNQLPYTCSCFCISIFSLCGMPFLAGFYSKDLILEYLGFSTFNFIIYLLFYLSVGLTVSYSFRLVYYCVGSHNGLFPNNMISEDSGMMFSMVMLAFLSITSGSILSWLILLNIDLLVFPIECKFTPIVFIIMGALIGYIFSTMSFTDMLLGLNRNLLISFVGSMWFMPYFSVYLLNHQALIMSKSFAWFMDYGWGENMVSGSFSSFFSWLSYLYTPYYNNSIKIYLISFLIMGLSMFIFNYV
uniref:NADH-ubiquinone oxidoreductase chain 5 n=1 Tax=Megymenum gracilicorne TaxID=763220 RepID=A0A4D6X0G1_9HEMI|nr:NADH dehydrogenase subunit 5 [Megymenum gracilicorne]QCI09384.1 NADH dehydrogenase subunit 5 [Megymenum gracilicorne]